MDKLYRQVAKRFAENKAISIKKENDYERISLAKQKKVSAYKRLKLFKETIYDLLPVTSVDGQRFAATVSQFKKIEKSWNRQHRQSVRERLYCNMEGFMSFKQGHALLIGVGTHQHHSQLDVPITVADAQAVQQVLEDSNLCGYPSNQVRLLKETSATKDGILDALDDLSQVPSTGTIFLFFAGHGSLGTDGDYYLLGHDVQLSGGRVKVGTGISEFELLQKLNAIPAKRLFMVFNACHSGLIAPGTLAVEKNEVPETLNPTGNTANALLGTGEGRILIVASREKQYSYIGPGQTTIFTKALTDGLKGEAGNNGGTISAFSLYEYIYHDVKETVADQYGRVQEPMLTVIRGVGPFPVALYRGASTLSDFFDDREILAETAMEEVSKNKAERSFQRIVRTGGGAFVGGNINTGGGNFIGGDKTIYGDEVRGDKVGGDKISVGDVSGSGVAIGRGASVSVTSGDTYSGDFRGAIMQVTNLAIATPGALLIARPGTAWLVEQHLEGKHVESIAVDPNDPTRLYVGTREEGLWRSIDGGRSWEPTGAGIPYTDITAVAVG
ncbi:MAG: caspase family protein, partial [Candidatus Promineifilaceae bacterium]|nr:caspase family protein [Candidatus Promineifilaceae bacterium]